MSAERTVYIICCDENETSETKNPVDYSEEELIEAYRNRSWIEYAEEEEFSTYEEAKEYFDNKKFVHLSLERTSSGYYYVSYRIYFIQKRIYDEDGELEDLEWLDIKTGSYRHNKTGSYTADHEV